MSMLAEPRRYRNRYNLVPRGKALYEDEERFGTKLLKKMGWSKGKGLGAKEQGDQEFVRVRYKNDERGLGFEDRDDHWTQHEESFNGLLKTLNGESDGSEKASGNISDEEVPRIGFGFAPEPKEKKAKLKDKISGESLEEKSKRSKARVHYKKFTKGKDLSQYSEKDLANIFGKKVTEELEIGTEEQKMVVAKKEYANDFKENKNNAETEMNSGFTINTGLSVNDYFKQKMEAMRSKVKNVGRVKEESENLIEECVKAPKIKKRKRSITEEESENLTEKHVGTPRSKKLKPEVIEIATENNDEPKKKKRKKNKVMKNEDLIELSEESNDLTINDCQQLLTMDKTKNEMKKKSKVRLDNGKADLSIESNETGATITEESKKKRKKKFKNKDIVVISSEEAVSSEACVENNTSDIKNKKNKKKNKDIDAAVETFIDSKECSTKKSKKKKSSSTNDEATSSAKKNKNVSSNNNNKLDQVVDVDNNNSNTAARSATQTTELLSLDDLIAKRDSYKVYTISSFCAEKFRHTAIENFNGSNMAHINGYSYEQDFKLDIQQNTNDQDNITQLWNCTLDKYRDAVPKYNFYKYVKEVRNARKAKVKPPRFNIKSWKRKHVFQGI